MDLHTTFSKWEALAVFAHVFLVPNYPISYSGNFAFPYLLLRPMTPSAPWKRASLLPTIRKPGLIRGRKEVRGPTSFTPIQTPSKSFSYCWTLVPMGLDRPALLNLLLPSLRKREAFLVWTGSRRQRGKGMYVEITQSLASVEKQDTCQSS